MDFFTRQEQARKKTVLLVISFVAAVVLIIVALYVVIAAILLVNKAIAHTLQPELFVAIVGITLTIVVAGSLSKMQQLKKGGRAVAEMLGARRVESDTREVKEKQLLNVVEEMSIASGTGMPSVYIIEEQGVNAFAAGWKTSDAAVCVTQGCLNYLTRDELQGVIAHEFSHILNGDMRLNIRLMGFIFGILVIGQIGYWVLRGTGRGRGVRVRSKGKSGGGVAVVMLVAVALLVIGYIGVFFGNLIKAAVSRNREFLADASAVQFTRNPIGISGALKKIGGLADGSRIMHPNASQASHLFFASGLSGFWSNLFATHPPLQQRIKAIEPAFDGEFPVVTVALRSDAHAGAPPIESRSIARPAPQRFDPALLLASVGAPTAEHVAYSSQLVSDVPNRLRLAMMDRIGAQSAIVALLLSGEAAVRERQVEAVKKADVRLSQRLPEIGHIAERLDRGTYATVFTLSINALRSMNEKEYQTFVALLKTLIEADQKIDLLEYMLMRMVRRTLEPRFLKNVSPGPPIQSTHAVAEELSVLLSVLAWEGTDSPGMAEKAFATGAAVLKGANHKLLPRDNCSLKSLDHNLEKLERLVPIVKRQVLNACFAVASTDGLITLNEAEYLRTVADALECPIPPVVVS
ncbi:MAG: M48 family metallopeptidase [Chitinispirillaceae bacterium]|nr:M48 family metallopeptidase [Chitinispirillaceae bacterium]